jgi:esterase/lipase superfamily enzyme
MHGIDGLNCILFRNTNATIMKPRKLQWSSPSLGKKVSIEVFGTGGTPIIHFDGYPMVSTSKERLQMLEGVRFQIENEFNVFYCPTMITESDILNKDSDPQTRLITYSFFESFVADELVPRIRKETGNDFIILSGIGVGAYHALNTFLKHPEKVNKLIAICGPVNLRPYFGDYFSETMYYNNPAEFLPNLNDHSIIEHFRTSDIRIVTSEFDPNKEQISILSDHLSFKNVDHILDVWGTDRENNPETWADMLKKHIP